MRVALVTVAAMLALAAPAAAATSFRVGTGDDPHLAVDSAGTAHIAWNTRAAAGDDTLNYCQVPRGASACSLTRTLPAPLGDTTRPYVFLPAPGTVLVLSHRCCRSGPNPTLLFTSADNGQSFGAPLEIGSISPHGDAALGPDGAIHAVTDVTTGATRYQRMALDGSTASAAPIALSRDHWYNGSVAFVGPTPIVTFDDLNNTAFTRWSGTGDANDASTWPALTDLGVAEEGRLASGPAGVFLFLTTGTPGRNQATIRAFDGTSFGAPTVIASEDPNVKDFFQDAAGHLHAVWRLNGTPPSLRYSTTASARASTHGAGFSTPVNVVREESLFDLEAATAADGRGFVVWDHNSGTGEVRAAPLEPAEPRVRPGEVVRLPSAKGCVSRRIFRIRIRQAKGVRYRRGSVFLNGRRVRVLRATNGRLTATVNLRGLPRGRFTVRITVETEGGQRLTGTRRYRTCVPRRRGSGRPRL